ncbi:MAG: ChaN family lipoprotein, partial [Planctomycetes bacterium]|nr:ChaN family lipoprotein [Planctomycetota bacterium]
MRPSWLLPLLLLPACATPPRIVATANYEVVDVATVADAVVGADVVCFGELHETPPVHRTHHELLAAIYERRPNLVIAMEMFE